jgi:multidrug efflux pump subunit AcrA (membrane-fusion protein)
MNAQRNGNGGERRARKAAPGDTPVTTEVDEEPSSEPVEDEAPPKPRRGVGRIVILLIAAGLAGLLYHYWGFWEQAGWFQTAQIAPAAPPPPAVTVAKPIEKELVEWKEFTGQFEAVDFVDVRARVSGYLESINFTDGQIVNKGDLLFVIEPKPY